MRKKLIAANWKMNKTLEEVNVFLMNFNHKSAFSTNDVEILICPSFPFLQKVSEFYAETGIMTGSQNISEFEKGAYTGEVSAMQLVSLSVTHAIIGHSERRKYFHESDVLLSQKVNLALHNDIIPVFCCGELLDERNAGNHFQIVEQQISNTLFHLDAVAFSKIIIAYEPVWAIGTGVNATTEQAQEMHAFIRNIISKKYLNDVAQQIQILYGGSCNPANARELFACKDVDGGLIGGASLQYNDFLKIIESAHE